jgi:hypothetical protein
VRADEYRMSADNYWIVVPHPDGGFSPVMGFASSDEYLDAEDVPVPRVGAPVFATAQEALASVWDDYAEYGHSISPLCALGEPMDRAAAQAAAGLVAARLRGLLERGEVPGPALLAEWADALESVSGGSGV